MNNRTNKDVYISIYNNQLIFKQSNLEYLSNVLDNELNWRPQRKVGNTTF